MLYGAFRDSLVKFYMGDSASDPVSTAWNFVMTKVKFCIITFSLEGKHFKWRSHILYRLFVERTYFV